MYMSLAGLTRFNQQVRATMAAARHTVTQIMRNKLQRLLMRRRNDVFGEGRVGEFRVVSKKEARSAASRIRSEDLRLRLHFQPFFEPAHASDSGLYACPLRQRDIDQQLGAIRVGKKLLLQQTHAEQRHKEQSDRRSGNQEFVISTPTHDACDSHVV